eukprot:291615-Pyramimonas_sp.AAC.2
MDGARSPCILIRLLVDSTGRALALHARRPRAFCVAYNRSTPLVMSRASLRLPPLLVHPPILPSNHPCVISFTLPSYPPILLSSYPSTLLSSYPHMPC